MNGFFIAAESDACDKCGDLIRKGERFFCESTPEWPSGCERRLCTECAP